MPEELVCVTDHVNVCQRPWADEEQMLWSRSWRSRGQTNTLLSKQMFRGSADDLSAHEDTNSSLWAAAGWFCTGWTAVFDGSLPFRLNDYIDYMFIEAHVEFYHTCVSVSVCVCVCVCERVSVCVCVCVCVCV